MKNVSKRTTVKQEISHKIFRQQDPSSIKRKKRKYVNIHTQKKKLERNMAKSLQCLSLGSELGHNFNFILQISVYFLKFSKINVKYFLNQEKDVAFKNS